MRLAAFFFGFLLLAGGARAGDIEIVAPWSRAMAPGQTMGVAYFTVVNHGAADVLRGAQIQGAQVDGSQQAMIYRSALENGVATMRALPDGLEIGAGATVALKPGGDHLMLMGLKKPLRQGDELSVTLDFVHAGKIAVKIPVDLLAATGPKKP